MKKYLATDINYCIDDLGEELDLPTTMIVECEDEDGVADAISDEVGWLIDSIGYISEIQTIEIIKRND